jgi:uncharacterized protein DUF2783
MKLRTEPNLDRVDDVYAALLALHEGLSPEQSAVASAKLILLLANHLGDEEVLRDAVRLARQDL